MSRRGLSVEIMLCAAPLPVMAWVRHDRSVGHSWRPDIILPERPAKERPRRLLLGGVEQ